MATRFHVLVATHTYKKLLSQVTEPVMPAALELAGVFDKTLTVPSAFKPRLVRLLVPFARTLVRDSVPLVELSVPVN